MFIEPIVALCAKTFVELFSVAHWIRSLSSLVTVQCTDRCDGCCASTVRGMSAQEQLRQQRSNNNDGQDRQDAATEAIASAFASDVNNPDDSKTSQAITIRVARIYEAPSDHDGYRVLVDRLWPRGIRKAAALFDEWNKDIALSTEIRKAFGHKDENFQQFREQYIDELNHNPAAHEFVQSLLDKKPTVTLLIAANNPRSNHGIVLKEFIEECLRNR